MIAITTPTIKSSGRTAPPPKTINNINIHQKVEAPP
jgi:hypothetical protein